MSHNYDAQTCFELARFNAVRAISIGDAIAAAYQGEKKLPENVVHAAKIFIEAHGVLKAAVFSAANPESDPTYNNESRTEARDWSSLSDVTAAASKLQSNKKKSEMAARLHQTMFPQGLAFLRLPVAERWVETERRVETIKKEKLESEFAAIGAGDFLAAVLDSHKALGAAAGITAPAGVAVKSGVGPAFDSWKAAVRCYAAQVVANQALALRINPNDKDAEALGKRLLLALATAESTTATKSETTTPDKSKTAETAAAAAASSAAPEEKKAEAPKA